MGKLMDARLAFAAFWPWFCYRGFVRSSTFLHVETMEYFDTSNTTIGLLIFLIMMGYAGGGLGSSIVIDKFGVKKATIGFGLLAVFGFFAVADTLMHKNKWILLCIYPTLLGPPLAICIATANRAIRDHATNGSLVLTIACYGSTAGAMIIPKVFVYLKSFESYQFSHNFYMLCGVMGTLVLEGLLLPEMKDDIDELEDTDTPEVPLLSIPGPFDSTAIDTITVAPMSPGSESEDLKRQSSKNADQVSPILSNRDNAVKTIISSSGKNQIVTSLGTATRRVSIQESPKQRKSTATSNPLFRRRLSTQNSDVFSSTKGINLSTSQFLRVSKRDPTISNFSLFSTRSNPKSVMSSAMSLAPVLMAGGVGPEVIEEEPEDFDEYVEPGFKGLVKDKMYMLFLASTVFYMGNEGFVQLFISPLLESYAISRDQITDMMFVATWFEIGGKVALLWIITHVQPLTVYLTATTGVAIFFGAISLTFVIPSEYQFIYATAALCIGLIFAGWSTTPQLVYLNKTMGQKPNFNDAQGLHIFSTLGMSCAVLPLFGTLLVDLAKDWEMSQPYLFGYGVSISFMIIATLLGGTVRLRQKV